VDLADVAFEQSEYGEAAAGLEAAENIYKGLQQPVGLAAVKSRQAHIAYVEERDDDVRRLCDEGLNCLPGSDGALVRSRTLRLLTDLALRARQLEEAADYCQQAQAANQTINDSTESAAILYAQAKLDHFLGDDAAALVNALRSAELYAAMGDRKATAIVHHTIAHLHRAGNNSAAAWAAAVFGLDLARSLGDDELVELFQEQLYTIDQFRIAAP
jgi:nitrate reductase alpha subunit